LFLNIYVQPVRHRSLSGKSCRNATAGLCHDAVAIPGLFQISGTVALAIHSHCCHWLIVQFSNNFIKIILLPANAGIAATCAAQSPLPLVDCSVF